jgi:retinol dehydrogenase-12
MQGKVCLVTGATSGIGLYTAVGLAKAGATVVMVGRDGVKGGQARAQVEALAGAGAGPIHLLLSDLASMSLIRKLAADVEAQFGALHVLVNNAGAINQTRTLTKDGYETTFGVNHLSYFLLTHLLLPLLERSGSGRIVNVASDAHKGGNLNFEDLQLERGWSGWKSYANSKLMNVMFTYALARRLEGKKVTANCLHPGVIASGFGKNDPGIFKFLVGLAQPFMLSSEKGAQTSIFLATAPEVEGQSGGYYARSKLSRSSGRSRDQMAQERLWTESAKLCGL